MDPEGKATAGICLGGLLPNHTGSRPQLRDLVLGGPAACQMGIHLDVQPCEAHHNPTDQTDMVLLHLTCKLRSQPCDRHVKIEGPSLFPPMRPGCDRGSRATG